MSLIREEYSDLNCQSPPQEQQVILIESLEAPVLIHLLHWVCWLHDE